MCGIAGYNCSLEFKEKHVTDSNQKTLLQEAWFHNLHRGSDAAGYMGLRDDNKIKAYKQAGAADTILKKNLKNSVLKPMRVFGAHTRARTLGSPKDNRNNHPVQYDGIWVTHNGTIQNHANIREWHGLKDDDKLGEVDSLAIPITLSQVADPFDIDVLEDALMDLWGSFAFHAMWRAYPGMSLLVKGYGSPLHVGINAKDGCVVYASELEAMWSMVETMGFNPNKDRWKYFEMEQESYLIVQDGFPFAWGDFESTQSYSKNTSFVTLKRMLPNNVASTQDNDTIIYATNRLNDWALKHGAWGRSVVNTPEEHRELEYTFLEGFTEHRKDAWPMNNDIQLMSLFSEADELWRSKHSGLYHVIFGDIEIIVNRREIQDVYDHGKGKMDDRWQQVDIRSKTDEKKEYALFNDFVDERLSKVVRVPSGWESYKFARKGNFANLGRGGSENTDPKVRMTPIPIANKKDTTTKNGQTPIQSGLKKTPNGLDISESGLLGHYINPPVELTYDNIASEVIWHKDAKDNGLTFLNKDWKCFIHGDVLLEEHDNPEVCNVVASASAFTYSCVVDNVEFVLMLLPTGADLDLDLDPISMACAHHDWVTSIYGEVRNKSGNYYDIPIGAECTICGAKKRIVMDTTPEWFRNIIQREKEVMTFVS